MGENGFSGWAIVELFGHNRIAGEISEQEIAGASFVRVDVPAVGSQPAFTKYYHPSAVYAITPTDERTATVAAEHFLCRPIDRWSLPDPRALPGPDDDGTCPECGAPMVSRYCDECGFLSDSE